MIRKAFLVISLVLAVLVPLAFAASADTLDDLLAETQKARKAEAEENKKREAEFLANRDRQKALFDDAQAKHNAARVRSEGAEPSFAVVGTTGLHDNKCACEVSAGIAEG